MGWCCTNRAESYTYTGVTRLNQQEEPMIERFSDVEASSLGPQSVEARLKTYPALRAKIETMLSLIENAGGEVEKAAVAEQRVIDALRELGNDVLQRWAHRQQQHKDAECQATPGVNRKKKNARLVYAARPNHGHGDDRHAGPPGARTAAVFDVGRGGLPRVLGGAATGPHRLWGGWAVCGGGGQAA